MNYHTITNNLRFNNQQASCKSFARCQAWTHRDTVGGHNARRNHMKIICGILDLDCVPGIVATLTPSNHEARTVSIAVVHARLGRRRGRLTRSLDGQQGQVTCTPCRHVVLKYQQAFPSLRHPTGHRALQRHHRCSRSATDWRWTQSWSSESKVDRRFTSDPALETHHADRSTTASPTRVSRNKTSEMHACGGPKEVAQS